MLVLQGIIQPFTPQGVLLHLVILHHRTFARYGNGKSPRPLAGMMELPRRTETTPAVIRRASLILCNRMAGSVHGNAISALMSNHPEMNGWGAARVASSEGVRDGDTPWCASRFA